MNSNAEKTKEITAALIALRYSSSIGIARFINEDGELTLYGESRMMSMLEEYIDQQLILFVKSESDWSWLPLNDNLLYVEL